MFAAAALGSGEARQWQQIAAILVLAFLFLFVRWLDTGRSVRLGPICLALPHAKVALAQIIVGGAEMASAIGALYVLMPAGFSQSFAVFSTVYVGAVLLGIISHSPGGLGVFEATILALGKGGERSGVLVALLIYRLIYNLGPFLLASLAFAAEEIHAALSSKAGSA
jgi:phosphatidylglycerol lysyltransferase